MSKLTTTLATLFLVATSTAALASPTTTTARASVEAGWSWTQPGYRTPVAAPAPQVRDHRDSRDDRWNPEQIRDHRDYDNGYQAPAARSWSVLGTVNWVVTDGSTVFPVNRARSLSEIKFVSNGGKSRIMGVKINFANGTQQTISMDRYVGNKGTVNIPASPSYTIDIHDQCPVTSIVVDGLNATSSSYSVYAL